MVIDYQVVASSVLASSFIHQGILIYILPLGTQIVKPLVSKQSSQNQDCCSQDPSFFRGFPCNLIYISRPNSLNELKEILSTLAQSQAITNYPIAQFAPLHWLLQSKFLMLGFTQANITLARSIMTIIYLSYLLNSSLN